MMNKRKTVQAAAGAKKPSKILTWAEERFVEAYIDNGGNALQAYIASHPRVKHSTACAHSHDYVEKRGLSEAIEAKRAAWRAQLNFTREKALNILIGQVTARLSDFSNILKDPSNKQNYVGLGDKEYALESGKKTETTTITEGLKVVGEIRIISNAERRNAINDLWEKLGLGSQVDKSNRFNDAAEFLRFVAQICDGPGRKPGDSSEASERVEDKVSD